MTCGDVTAAALAWIGAAFTAVVIGASVAIAGPINAAFMAGDQGTVPDGAGRNADEMARFHWSRTAIALAALASVALGATAEPVAGQWACRTRTKFSIIDTPESLDS